MKAAGIDVHKEVLMAVVVDASMPEETGAPGQPVRVPPHDWELILLQLSRRRCLTRSSFPSVLYNPRIAVLNETATGDTSR